MIDGIYLDNLFTNNYFQVAQNIVSTGTTFSPINTITSVQVVPVSVNGKTVLVNSVSPIVVQSIGQNPTTTAVVVGGVVPTSIPVAIRGSVPAVAPPPSPTADVYIISSQKLSEVQFLLSMSNGKFMIHHANVPPGTLLANVDTVSRGPHTAAVRRDHPPRAPPRAPSQAPPRPTPQAPTRPTAPPQAPQQHAHFQINRDKFTQLCDRNPQLGSLAVQQFLLLEIAELIVAEYDRRRRVVGAPCSLQLNAALVDRFVGELLADGAPRLGSRSCRDPRAQDVHAKLEKALSVQPASPTLISGSFARMSTRDRRNTDSVDGATGLKEASANSGTTVRVSEVAETIAAPDDSAGSKYRPPPPDYISAVQSMVGSIQFYLLIAFNRFRR